MTGVRIAFVIPAYNAATTVAQAVQSARAQTAAASEIIVVDDGSSDDTATIADRAGARVLTRSNGGPAAARNMGIRATDADWIALLDADDLCDPQRLERQRTRLDDPTIAVVHAAHTADPEQFVDRVGELDFTKLWQRNRIVTSSVLLRRAAWEAAGGFDEDRALIGVEDYNLWLRLARSGWRFSWMPEVLVAYQPTESSLTSQTRRFAYAELANARSLSAKLGLPAAMLEQKEYQLFREYGIELLHVGDRPGAREFLREAARRGSLDWKARTRRWASILPMPGAVSPSTAVTAEPVRRNKALMIAYYYPPLGSSGAIRTLKFVKYLRDCGWDAVVITVAPEFEQLEPVDESLLSEVPASTVVIRTYAWQPARIAGWLTRRRSTVATTTTAPPSPVSGGIRKSGLHVRAGMILRFLGRGGWFPFAVLAALKAVRKYDIDVIYTSAPRFSGSLAGVIVKKLTGKPLVSDFRDPWVGNTYNTPAHPLLGRLATFLERKTFEASDRILSVSPDFEEKAKARSAPWLHGRFMTIPNGFDPEDLPAAASPAHRPEFRVTYTGCFYPGSREPSNFLRALSLLRSRDPAAFRTMRVQFVGEPQWAEQHRDWLATLEVGEQAVFLPFVPHRQAVELLRDSDVLLLLGSVKTADTGTLPAKLFEYLAVGRPILALVHDGESARLVRASGVGVVANPQEPEEILAALLRLSQLIRSGEFAGQVNSQLLQRHDRRRLTEELAAVFNAVSHRGVTTSDPLRGNAEQARPAD